MSEAKDDVLRTTLDVEHNGITYTFAIPGFADELKLGVAERAIRRIYDPETGGSPFALDQTTSMMFQAAAVFENLLRNCDDTWPYTANEKGEPVVDHTKFSPDRVQEVTEVWIKFTALVDEFRKKRNSDRKPAGAKAVAGGADSPPVAVQPGPPEA